MVERIIEFSARNRFIVFLLIFGLANGGPTDEEAAWTVFSRYRDQAFSFTDCASFALMERLKVKVALALDNDFRAYGLPCLPEKN